MKVTATVRVELRGHTHERSLTAEVDEFCSRPEWERAGELATELLNRIKADTNESNLVKSE